MAIQKTIPFSLEIKEVPVAPDFFPAIDPLAASVFAGAVATYSISFTTLAGFANPISLAVVGLPEGATATFGLNPALPTDVVSLAITTVGAPIGTFALLIEATEVPPS